LLKGNQIPQLRKVSIAQALATPVKVSDELQGSLLQRHCLKLSIQLRTETNAMDALLQI
jgi:hypothetical protein